LGGGPTVTIGVTPGGNFGFVAQAEMSASPAIHPLVKTKLLNRATRMPTFRLTPHAQWQRAAAVSTNLPFSTAFHRTLTPHRRTGDEQAALVVAAREQDWC
jgi:hypothetical protein